jgi:hypothetical protein
LRGVGDARVLHRLDGPSYVEIAGRRAQPYMQIDILHVKADNEPLQVNSSNTCKTLSRSH